MELFQHSYLGCERGVLIAPCLHSWNRGMNAGSVHSSPIDINGVRSLSLLLSVKHGAMPTTRDRCQTFLLSVHDLQLAPETAAHLVLLTFAQVRDG